MENIILKCAQGIFDRIECAVIEEQPNLLEKISFVLADKIWQHTSVQENYYITKELADIIENYLRDKISVT